MLQLLIENLRLFLLSLLSLAVSFLSSSLFRSSLSGSHPASPNEKRAGHKSGATPVRDCNLTGYIVLNCVCLVSIYRYICIPVLYTAKWYAPRSSVAARLIDHFTRINVEKEVADELDKTSLKDRMTN